MCWQILFLTAAGLYVASSYSVGGGVQPFKPQYAQIKQAGDYCQQTAECAAGLECIASVNSVKICLPSNNNRYPNGCASNFDCGSNQVCVTSINGGKCEINVGGNIGRQECAKDADCAQPLSCVDYLGRMECRRLECETDEHCPSKEHSCVWSTAMARKICYKYGDLVTDGYIIPIRRQFKPQKPQVIDPAAPICEFDYHCRMGEACSEEIHLTDRTIRLCRYHADKEHRQCIFHSDCMLGQHCTATQNNTATCEPFNDAHVSCHYDYECSGGRKCQKLGERFECAAPLTEDARRGQLCSSNADCPFRQVCRQHTHVPICVDIMMSLFLRE